MFCPQCGTQIPDDSVKCPSCSHRTTPKVAPKPKLTDFLSGNLFLAICVLISASTLLSFNVLSLLIAIFCWLIFSSAKKAAINSSAMHGVNVVLLVTKILCIVAAVFLFIGSLVSAALAISIGPEDLEDLREELSDSKDFKSELKYEIKESLNELKDENPIIGGFLKDNIDTSELTETVYGYAEIYASLGGMGIFLILALFFILYGVGMIISSIMHGKLYKFGKALSGSCGDNSIPEINFDTACVTLIICAVLSALAAIAGAFVSVFALFSGLCSAAAYAVAFVMLKKIYPSA